MTVNVYDRDSNNNKVEKEERSKKHFYKQNVTELNINIAEGIV
jgi:hypothetical protein